MMKEKRLYVLAALVLFALATFAWPTPYKYWVIDQASSECIVQMNRFTGHTVAYCGRTINRGWEHYQDQESPRGPQR